MMTFVVIVIDCSPCQIGKNVMNLTLSHFQSFPDPECNHVYHHSNNDIELLTTIFNDQSNHELVSTYKLLHCGEPYYSLTHISYDGVSGSSPLLPSCGGEGGAVL
jgi:hypothetical protein